MESTMGNWQGKKIGRYQITQLLGQNSSCSVWLAIDTCNQQQVAIKLLPTVPVSNRAYLIEVAAQARAVAVLEHPHILTLQDFGEQETERGEIVPYLVMPYARGGTLADRMRVLNGMLPVYESLRYLRQAARGLDYAHSKQMLHRDVRPENMFLRQGWLQLADFGVAKILSSTNYQGKMRPESRTPEYMAPELIDGKEDTASDRYSLAVIAYQLFTGHFPFQGKTTYETLSRQVREHPPEPRQFNTSMPLEVEQILMRGLAKRPEERPASCAEFLDTLEFGWKASGKSADNPDSTWLAPWSKRWLADGEPQSQAEATVLKAQPEKTDAMPTSTVIQPQETPGVDRPAARHNQPAWSPELPSWLPEPFKEAHNANLAPFLQSAPGTNNNRLWQSAERSMQSPQSLQEAPTSLPTWSPELPSWLPAPFGEAPVNQPTRLWPKNPALQATQATNQSAASPAPQKLQSYDSGYQEATQRSNNIIQKPLSFDAIVRNAIATQATGEMPEVTKEPVPTPEAPPQFAERAGKQESFSGIIRGAIASQQSSTPSLMMLQETFPARDNSAKFEAVVKQAMGTEQQNVPPAMSAMSAMPVAPLPTASPQETTQSQREIRLKQWEQQLRPRLQEAYAWINLWLQRARAWTLQQLSKYGLYNKE
jgi:serine/threonine protein kinase